MKKGIVSRIITISVLHMDTVYAQPQQSTALNAALDATPASLTRASTEDDGRSFGDYFVEANRGYILGSPRHVSFRRALEPVRYRLMTSEHFPVAHTAGRLLCENADGSFLLVCQRTDGRRWRSRHYRCTSESEANPLLLFPSDCVRHDVWTIEGRSIQLPAHTAPVSVGAERSTVTSEGQRPTVQWPAPVVDSVRDALNTAARLPNGAAHVATGLIRGVARSFDTHVPVVTPKPRLTPVVRRPSPIIVPASRVSPPAPETSWLRNIVILGAMALYGVMGFLLLRLSKKAQQLETENEALQRNPSAPVATYPPDATTLPPAEDLAGELAETRRLLAKTETDKRELARTSEALLVQTNKKLRETHDLARRESTARKELERQNTELRGELARVRDESQAQITANQQKNERAESLRLQVTTLKALLESERDSVKAQIGAAEKRIADYWKNEIDRWRAIAGIYYEHCLTARIDVPPLQVTERRLNGLATIPPAAAMRTLGSPPSIRTATDSSAPPPHAPTVRPPAAAGYPLGPAGTAPDESGPRASSPRYQFGGPDPRDTEPYSIQLEEGVPNIHRAPTGVMATGAVAGLQRQSSDKPPEGEELPPPNAEKHAPLATPPQDQTKFYHLDELIERGPSESG